MKRSDFLKVMAGFPLISCAMKSNELSKLKDTLSATDRMPVLFLGHGSPMNAIEENEFVREFRAIGNSIAKPKAVLCISAHWETNGTYVTAMKMPRTIHDFGGFPQALFDVQYPAPGDPQLATDIKSEIKKTSVGLDEKWGLDHGAWSVVKHLYPEADVPVLQMSLDYNKPPQYHYELAKELDFLRSRGVLIVGSGNMVHNLGMAAFDKFHIDNYGYDWAIEASTMMKKYIADGDHQKMINYRSNGKAWDLSIPSPEHYLPLLYILGLQGKNESITFHNDKAQAGSLTMTSIKIS
jgi:4,5-DOPA dioxygenase extradiol